MSGFLWLLALLMWALALGNFVHIQILSSLSHHIFSLVGPMIGIANEDVLAVVAIFVGIGLVWLVQLFGKPMTVQCESCGWKGSYNKFKEFGGCPVCGSDQYKIVK